MSAHHPGAEVDNREASAINSGFAMRFVYRMSRRKKLAMITAIIVPGRENHYTFKRRYGRGRSNASSGPPYYFVWSAIDRSPKSRGKSGAAIRNSDGVV